MAESEMGSTESEMGSAVANLCHSVISVITRFVQERTEIPDHVSVSCSFNDVDISFDIYLAREEHATAQG